ncbi:MAG: AAA family ATPase [Candidatus Eisenbacteria bacterium]|nr:AAA family ATPase [Candidatus Eisenbacteria bacterium]
MPSAWGAGAFFVGVCGNIGVGKSVFAELLGQRLGWPVYYEPVAENPFLDDFYRAMNRWAFHLQIYFLAERFKAQKTMVARRRPFVQDRTIYEDGEIFARVLRGRGAMDHRDYETFLALFREMVALLPPPGLLVFLAARPDTLLARIAQRGRACEASIDADYLGQLDAAYAEWLPMARRLCPVITIDTDAFTFPPDDTVLGPLLARIRKAERERRGRLSASTKGEQDAV